MSYTLPEVATLIDAHTHGTASPTIEWLLTDSRSLAYPESSLFFALRTPTGDGHRYIADLYRRGVRAFVVGSLPAEADTLFSKAAFLIVASPLGALQRLAEVHRLRYHLPVIGITGSNGKTIVKEWLYQLLDHAPGVTRSPRSYNSQIGVPLSVWQLNDRSQLGIFEAGISQPREMSALRHIIRPTLGILTNLGPAHQENFATLEAKCLEKLKLFRDCPALVYPAADALIGWCIGQSGYAGRLISWECRHLPTDEDVPQGEQAAAVFAFDAQTTPDGRSTLLRCTKAPEGMSIPECTLPFTDNASIDNALTALTALYSLPPDCSLRPSGDDLAARIASLQPVAMRMEVKCGVRDLTLIDDAYNADLASLDLALDVLARRREGRRAVLILSDLQQTGCAEGDLYAHVAELAVRRGVDLLIGIGPALGAAHHAFPMAKHFFPSTEALLQSRLLDTLEHDVVLLKGARAFHFERIADELQQKVHETTLEVNLSALADNLRHYRAFMRPDTRITCMVKAGAYGSGSIEVAHTLQELGVDYLAVAVADEGVELRKAGITAGILIMNPEMSALHTLFKYRLEPEVYNFRLLDALIAAARAEGITDFPVHLKLDTGMCRLGFHPEEELDALIDRLSHQQALLPRSVFSHFVGSDSADFDAFSAQQFERFDRASRRLCAAFPHRILRHICNSAGIARFPERHLDMCRLGLGLYGVDPVDNHTLANVATLRTTILQIRNVPAGTSVGYSRRTVLDRPSRIAAIPIGYADGLDRHLGNRRGHCLVQGHPAPYVGNICMDVCMIDVTDIPCHEGDSVEIFGDALPVATLADRLDTIPYEILTSVSTRVKRVYFR